MSMCNNIYNVVLQSDFYLYSLLPYQVFVEAFHVDFGKCNPQIWIAILVVPIVVLSWIRNLDELSSFSMVANICILIALVIIFFDEVNAFVYVALE